MSRHLSGEEKIALMTRANEAFNPVLESLHVTDGTLCEACQAKAIVAGMAMTMAPEMAYAANGDPAEVEKYIQGLRMSAISWCAELKKFKAAEDADTSERRH